MKIEEILSKCDHTLLKQDATWSDIKKICDAFQITLSQFFDCDLFDSKKDSQLYIELWNKLHPSDQEKVLIYMRGLLHIEITKEDLKDDL